MSLLKGSLVSFSQAALSQVAMMSMLVDEDIYWDMVQSMGNADYVLCVPGKSVKGILVELCRDRQVGMVVHVSVKDYHYAFCIAQNGQNILMVHALT